jgi:hypothetical protein
MIFQNAKMLFVDSIDVRLVCARRDAVNDSAQDGLRKRNVFSLFAQYCPAVSMRFSNTARSGKPGGHLYQVITLANFTH